ncbi:hypothetical protein A6F68_01174 [Tsuneonella dongtanensis]|uniref:Uncharacterized protein n=1 Tax=Tsuneonella dongtanensis TaxID=692370 RepID=A0A1B2AC05_9SPHN|nr:hypothetical protein [Tsuneonella dongtanensis]ANY19692.1 hypothetical protein A6F68_01174 [Tsuneonella dongtanensis]
MNRALIAWMYSLAGEARSEVLAILTSPAIRTAILWLGPFVGVIVGLDLAAHYGDATGAALPAQFFISQDHSLGECFEYALTGSSALMLFAMWRRLGQTAYLANALLMVWLTLDNLMEFHEEFGHWVAPFISLPANSPVHANDIGEMLFFGMIGGFWLIGLASAVFGAQARAAVRSLYIACGIGCAAVFGVVVDMMVTWGPHTLAQTNFQAWLEDGGEFAFLNLTFLMVVAFFHVERMAWRQKGDANRSPAAV